MKARPSYSQGFARNAAQSARPGHWQGLYSCFCPGLGHTGNKIIDQSGRGHHAVATSGSVVGSPTVANNWAVDNGWCVRFHDSVDTSDSYFWSLEGVAGSGSFDPVHNGHCLTVSLWFKKNGSWGTSNYGRLFDIESASPDERYVVMHIRNNGGGTVFTRTRTRANGSHQLLEGSNTAIADDEWYHYVARWSPSGSNTALEVFLSQSGDPGITSDGTATYTGTIDSIDPATVAKIGAHSSGYEAADFLEDDIRVYSRSLSDAEIDDIFRAGRGAMYEMADETPLFVPLPVADVSVDATADSLAIADQGATLSRDLAPTADSLAVTDQAATLNRTLDATSASLTITGYSVTLSRTLDTATDALSITDNAAVVGSNLDAAADSLTLNDQAVTFTVDLLPGVDSLAITDYPVSLDQTLAASAGSLAITDQAATLARELGAISDALTITDHDASVADGITATADSLTITDHSVTFTIELLPGADTLAITDYAAIPVATVDEVTLAATSDTLTITDHHVGLSAATYKRAFRVDIDVDSASVYRHGDVAGLTDTINFTDDGGNNHEVVISGGIITEWNVT